MSDLISLQQRVALWHQLRFPAADETLVALKAAEEVGELASAVLAKEGRNATTGEGDVLGEAADVVIALMVLIGRWSGDELLDAVERKLAILTDPASGHRAALPA